MRIDSLSNKKSLIFEQPLNEQIRICLRLEQLLSQLHGHLDDPSSHGSQMALLAILRIIDVIDRPDIKSKLMQTLTQYTTTLGQLERLPQVDNNRLQPILNQLDGLMQQLHRMQGRVGDTLRSNEFLMPLRTQLSNPGGIFLHHVPNLALWLNQPYELRSSQLKEWSSGLHPLPAISELVLDLTRSSTNPQEIETPNGFYHQPLDPTLPCHMIRVVILTESEWGIYPEISAGKHRLSVRFLEPNFESTERPKQAKTVRFLLTCCRL